MSRGNASEPLAIASPSAGQVPAQPCPHQPGQHRHSRHGNAGQRNTSQRRPAPRLTPRSVLALTVCLGLAVAGCGRAPTDDVLRGGVPARTNLHKTTTLPPDAIRSVARKDAGWRLIYHPARAPVNAEQGAAAALCRLERKRPAEIVVLPMVSPYDDPGARMIDVVCA